MLPKHKTYFSSYPNTYGICMVYVYRADDANWEYVHTSEPTNIIKEMLKLVKVCVSDVTS